ncbi:MAG: hypothetical protein IPJ65_08685 [Archangiaceae bacterium]|nr:hypothetical protein [Archangiaceae bacterium]
MSDQLDPKLLDKRTAERHIRTGKLDDKTWDKHLKSLPDVAEKAVAVESTMADIDDLDDDIDDEDDGDEG